MSASSAVGQRLVRHQVVDHRREPHRLPGDVGPHEVADRSPAHTPW